VPYNNRAGFSTPAKDTLSNLRIGTQETVGGRPSRCCRNLLCRVQEQYRLQTSDVAGVGKGSEVVTLAAILNQQMGLSLRWLHMAVSVGDRYATALTRAARTPNHWSVESRRAAGERPEEIFFE
jgi:hypothetical protein